MTASLADLMQEILQFRDERDWKQFHTPRQLASALSIEVAELQEVISGSQTKKYANWWAIR